jgi:hypothetical protein
MINGLAKGWSGCWGAMGAFLCKVLRIRMLKRRGFCHGFRGAAHRKEKDFEQETETTEFFFCSLLHY